MLMFLILVLFLGEPSKNSRVHSFALWGSRGPLLRPRCKTQHYFVIGVRSGALLGQNGPGTREWCTFSKGLFLVVCRESTLYFVFCVPLGAPGPLRAPSGEAPGPNDQTKVTATLRPVLGRVLRCGQAAEGAPDRESRRTGVPKALVATGVCSKPS